MQIAGLFVCLFLLSENLLNACLVFFSLLKYKLGVSHSSNICLLF